MLFKKYIEGENTMTAEKIREIADQCKAEWKNHFAKYYVTQLPGDDQKRDGIVLGIDSLVEELIRFEEDNG